MLFNSLEFLVFLPLVVAAYFALPHRLRWALLLAASYVFYASWRVEYLALIVASTLIDYWAGLRMGAALTRRGRVPYLLASLGSNLGILFAFKYLGFVTASVQGILDAAGTGASLPVVDLLLPVGISFYTFQTLAYSIDVFRGRQKPERHLGIFALYVSFFPQLVAGPIERSTHLLPQFHAPTSFRPVAIGHGLTLMLWGYFKKLVIADRVAPYVTLVYGDPAGQSGVSILLATYLFAFQIFCDFSAYTDIARGSARMMGYDLMENFRRPYFAASLGEFWRRWHISLSTWFRDYLYVPLGGNRVPRARWYANLFVVFLVSGLWHGAAWTFVIWGALHGAVLVLEAAAGHRAATAWGERRWPRFRGRSLAPPIGLAPIVRPLRVVATFHVVLVAWIFFRASSVGDAFALLGGLFRSGDPRPMGSTFPLAELAIPIAAIVAMELVHLAQESGRARPYAEWDRASRWTTRYLLAFGILLFGRFGATEFIYFQF